MKLSKTLSITVLVLFLSFPANGDSNYIAISTDKDYRYITANGWPDHAPGQFPNRGNPNSISEQSYNYRVTLNPSFANRITEMHAQPFGVAVNGVPFDPGTAEYYNNDRSSGWNYDALSGKINLGIDHHNAHVQPNGAYHYHGIPYDVVKEGITGWAADGFPIVIDANAKTSYRLKQGTRPSGPKGQYDGTYVQDFEYIEGLGELDECNGRINANGQYEYVLTNTFPFIPRCWKGTPDQSFSRKGNGGPEQMRNSFSQSQGQEQGTSRQPPKEAQTACKNRSSGTTCQFNSPHGQISGTCRNIGRDLACVPNDHRNGPPPRL